MKRVLAPILWAIPTLALACPVCARDVSRWAAALVAAMIAVPYAVAAVVIRAVRRSGGEP